MDPRPLVVHLEKPYAEYQPVAAPIPGVFGMFAGFADDAKVEDGWLKLPDRPGIGFEAQNALYAEMRRLVS